MGGTEIYDPLNFAIKDFLSKSFVEKYMPKNIIKSFQGMVFGKKPNK